MKIVLISTLLLFVAFIGLGCFLKDRFDMTDIDKAIRLTTPENHKKLLRDFKNQHPEAETIQVASHYNKFEIIVTSRDSEEYTGGTVQYFVSKKTGETKMGWHEAPIRISREN